MRALVFSLLLLTGCGDQQRIEQAEKLLQARTDEMRSLEEQMQAIPELEAWIVKVRQENVQLEKAIKDLEKTPR